MSLLGPYPSPAQRAARLDALADTTGEAVEVIGHSVEGRPIRALEIRRGASSDSPLVLVVGNIHGPEFISSQVALGCVQATSDGHRAWAQLCEQARVCVVPCLNPDGYARTYEAQGRGCLSALRSNARGVDLNRNFPIPRGERRWPIPGAGSSNPEAPTYHGPSPLSEPESMALAKLARRERPHACVGLHSFMGRTITPRVRDRVDYAQYGRLCRAFARAQPSWKYGRLASRLFDVFTGEQEDFLHHELRCWSICVETFSLAATFSQHLRAPRIFDRFNPADPAPWVANDIEGIVAFFRRALQLPRPGSDEPRPGLSGDNKISG